MEQDMREPEGNTTGRGPSRMAGGIALLRYWESKKPEEIRIFCDPYAIHFVDPALIAWAQDHPEEARAGLQQFEEMAPGWNNTILARIRYFDDAVQDACREGISQILMLGAGYDTRAMRMTGTCTAARIFEVDRRETLENKAAVLRKAAITIPQNVISVPCDMGEADVWPVLGQAGFSPVQKTLVILEGLVMYLPRPATERLLAGIARHTGTGSRVLFDFVPASLADGTLESEGAQNIRAATAGAGEPILSGFAADEVVPFLEGLGCSGVTVVPSRDFARTYYTGKNAGRKVSGLLSIAHAKTHGQGGHDP
jgi:methyltransferase (TIGR00027 family)